MRNMKEEKVRIPFSSGLRWKMRLGASWRVQAGPAKTRGTLVMPSNTNTRRSVTASRAIRRFSLEEMLETKFRNPSRSSLNIKSDWIHS